MQWEDRSESENVEDVRGMGVGAKAGIAAGGGGILILLVALLLGVNPNDLGRIIGRPQRQEPAPTNNKQIDPREEKLAKFTKVILKDTEDVWSEQFAKHGVKYQNPKMVLFSGAVNSGCGYATAQVGPFYCPADRKLYLDLSFFDEMEKKMGAPGEFARAYVVAHEVGHHVQNLLGYSRIADEARKTPRENEYSVRLELQADYLAGVWANHIQKKYADKYEVLNPRDIKSGLNAANKIGDDWLQSKGRGRVMPDSFTHGTSEARAHWLADGMRTGDFSKQKLDAFFKLPYSQVDIGLNKVGR